MLDPRKLRERFQELFGATQGGAPEPRICRAPGRVNLIGEHVDYNDGWVLPMAIDRACVVLARARSDGKLRIHSEQMADTVEARLDDPRGARHHWSDYPRGVAWALGEAGHSIPGADLLISSEVPLGSGLSSSAALEVSTAFALLGVANQEMPRQEIALACQRAEYEFVGMRCGIMDQLTACFGRVGHALLIDCRTLEVEPVPLDESQVRVVVANTMVKHALASSEFNRRREDCEDAVARIRAHKPGVRALRDVTSEELAAWAGADWPERVVRRARHVVTEIARVHQAVAALREGNYARMGELMAESHASLDKDYEVSSPELDTMVALARQLPGCYGARMTGGGFGGCTVNLVGATEAEPFSAALAVRYEKAAGRRAEIYVCRSAGAAEEC